MTKVLDDGVNDDKYGVGLTDEGKTVSVFPPTDSLRTLQ